LIVAATRQNAGTFFTEAGGALTPGGMNAPAATGCARVMVVSGNFSAARLSQVAALAEPDRGRRITTKVRKQVCARRTSVTNTLPVEELEDAESYQNHCALKESSCTFEAPAVLKGSGADLSHRIQKYDKRSEHRVLAQNGAFIRIEIGDSGYSKGICGSLYAPSSAASFLNRASLLMRKNR
jgi:hypothetical protein